MSVAEARLASLIARHPDLAARFESLGLDFCCHGDRPLREACAAAGVRLADALDAVATVDSGHDPGSAVNWPQLGIVDLVDHIEDVHHRYLQLELPSLLPLSAKVLSTQGLRHPELARVETLVSDLRDEFVQHMAQEERVLFPAIRALAAGRIGFAFGSVADRIALMESEHESIGHVLRQIREASSGFNLPAEASESHRRLYERLSALECDTHVHVMKENSFLFPRAVELEAALMAG